MQSWPDSGFRDVRWDERRRGRRYPCPAHVAIGNRWVVGRDISRGGIAVFMQEPLPVGHVTMVSLGRKSSAAGEMSGAARVIRSELNPLGFLVALEFLELHREACEQ